jgi:hypothetical protein
LVLMRDVRAMAPGLSLSHFYYMQCHDPPNWDCMIIVRDPNDFFNPLLEAAMNHPGWRDRVFLVDTPTEAEALIQARRLPA